MSAYSQKTYALGGQIVLSCTMNYGQNGVETTDVTWSGISGSVASSKYTIDKVNKQPIIIRYLGHVIGYQPIRDQYYRCNLFWY